MRHYKLVEWAEFVRGMVPSPGLEREMEAHLESGCRRCGDAAGAFRRVAEVAREERRLSPPESSLRIVGALFGLSSPRDSAALRAIPMELAFSSIAEAGHGLRNGEEESHQVTYATPDLALSLDVRPGSEGRPLWVGGDVVDLHRGPLPQMPVLLLAGERLADYTQSGEAGDFLVSSGQREDLRLRVLVSEREYVEVPIDLGSSAND